MKRKYKITPVSGYDIRGLESWLEDMARRGYILKKLRSTVSTFERGPSQAIRYRAEPFKRTMADDSPPQAMLDLYQDFGWELVGDMVDILVFSTRDPDAPEPHSDPELQAQLWKKLYRSRRNIFFIELAVALLLLFGVPHMIFGQGAPVLTLLTTNAPILVIYLVFFLVSLPGLWADAQGLKLLVKQLEAGVPLDHRSVYPARRWREIVNCIIVVTLLIAIIVVQNILPLTGGSVRPLDELTAFTPLSLTEVEGEGYKPDRYVMDGRDYANFCDLTHYLLCWDQWEVVQTGDIEPDGWVRMEIQWYDLPGWLSRLSAPLARELLENVMIKDQDIWWTGNGGAVWTVDYLPCDGVSFLAVARRNDADFQIAAAASGDKAVLVRYTGQGDLAEWVDEIAEMVL